MENKQKNPDFVKARNYALRLLKIRLRSKKELEGRLRKKGYSLQTIEDVIYELEKSKLVDDKRFARFFASDQLEFHIKGPRYVRYKLKTFGVEDFIAENAVREIYEEADLREIFYRFVRTHRFKSQKEISEMLIRRGFDSQMVHETLLAIYDEWRCKDESGNNAHFDIRSDSHSGSDIGLPPREDKGTQGTKKG